MIGKNMAYAIAASAILSTPGKKGKGWQEKVETPESRLQQYRYLRDETNAHFAAHDTVFRRACILADVEATKRQASKYRNGRGRAFAFHRQALEDSSNA